MTDDIATAQILMTIGGLFLLGLLADLAGRHTPLPRVTLLLVAGFLVGPSALDWLPPFTGDWFGLLTNVALAMIGFLLGQNLTRARLARLGRVVLTVSGGVVIGTPVLMFLGLMAFGVAPEVALLLAGISTATDPAATVDVVREYHAEGEFSETLLGVAAIDDAWGLLVFTLLLAAAQVVAGHDGVTGIVLAGLWEVGGAMLLGVLLGLPMSYLTGRIRPGEPTQAEALGVVLLCAGIADWLGVSYILSAMVLGTVVANLARHHNRPFMVIEGIEWPFLILFFLLAGAALPFDALAQTGPLLIGYVLLRILGRLVGAGIGGRLGDAPPTMRRWMGLAMLPQAGLAIGMALLAVQRFPDAGGVILPVVLGSTVVFELVGPVLTRWILIRVGEVPADPDPTGES
ncbi:MAG: cation:proton antiporter [Pseudomonadales bacterium]